MRFNTIYFTKIFFFTCFLYDISSQRCEFQEKVIIGTGYISKNVVADKESCCRQCLVEEKCLAFTFKTDDSTCFLKNNTLDLHTMDNRISGGRPNSTLSTRACIPGSTFSNLPFCDRSKTIDQRVDDLISRLEKDEKPVLLTARADTVVLERLGVPEYDWGMNAIHGVQSTCGTKDGMPNCATSFPSPNALGCTWNMSLVHDMGHVIGVEARSLWLQGAFEAHHLGLHIGLDTWSPNININRDPRWGRNQEVPGEDPYLAGRFGVAYTRGLQEGDDPRYLQAVVTLKHWDAYSLESFGNASRHNFNAKVSPYMLSDTYWPAWKASVTEGKAKGVMCSYNSLNGIPTCASKFLNNVLRNKWNFTGYITSDSGAVKDIYKNHKFVKTAEEAAAKAISDGGCDIDSGSVYKNSLITALEKGLCTMDDVDTALRHTLKLRFELGLFEGDVSNISYWNIPPSAVNTTESQALNLLSAKQSMVLLKNTGRVLPFSRGKTVAVIGPHGNATKAIVGNYLGDICPGGRDDFTCVKSPYLAIREINVGGTTLYEEGCDIVKNDTTGFAAAVAAAKKADYVLLGLGIMNGAIEREGHDRTDISLPMIQHQLTKAILEVGKPTAMFLLNGGMVALGNDTMKVPAILECMYPGFQGGQAIAETIFGLYNPGGKLPVTWYTEDYIKHVDMYDMDFQPRSDGKPGRSYKYYDGPVEFPFAWGLSYTTFKLEIIKTQPSSLPKHYELRVTNTGNMAGDEVIFAFFKPKNLTTQPKNKIIKQLFGFKRVHLEKGAASTVSFDVDRPTLQLVDVNSGNIIIAPGEYEIEFTNGVKESVSDRIIITDHQIVLEHFPVL